MDTEVSGLRCKKTTAVLGLYHRILGSKQYSLALNYVRNILTQYDECEVKIDSYPVDGKIAYGDWIAPPAWNANSAYLKVLEPDKTILCDYNELPISLHVGSSSTSEAEIVCRLIDIGDGLEDNDYQDAKLNGNIGLCSGDPRKVFHKAVHEYGALGIVSDFMSWQVPKFGRTPQDQPDMLSYIKIPISGNEEKKGFSFGISARQGIYLRSLLNKGAVTLAAHVDARVFKGSMKILDALIRGNNTDDKEIILIAHLCHPAPGANDNASGVALILEIIRVMLESSKTDNSFSLSYNIRILLVPEAYGAIAWLMKPENQIRRNLVINLDMVGGDIAKTNGHLWLDTTPWGTPSFINDLFIEIMNCVKLENGNIWNFSPRSYMGGSDHSLFLAPEWNSPAIMIGQEPDIFYHSQEDSVDKTSTMEFQLVGESVLRALRILNNPCEKEAMQFLLWAFNGSMNRISNYFKQLCEKILIGDFEDIPSQDGLFTLLEKEKSSINSVQSYLKPKLREQIYPILKQLEDYVTHHFNSLLEIFPLITSTSHEPVNSHDNDERIPKKLFIGPLSPALMGPSVFIDRIGEKGPFYLNNSGEDRSFVRWFSEATNLMDGKRSVTMIRNILEGEFGKKLASDKALGKLIDDLLYAKYITIEPLSKIG